MSAPETRDWRHWGGFALAGSTAFLVDSSVLMLLTRIAGVPPLAARLVAIFLAMIVSWAINRTITFPARTPATVREFLQFAGVASGASAINYIVFAGLILLIPSLHELIAVAIACAFAMVASYAGMKFGVFRRAP